MKIAKIGDIIEFTHGNYTCRGIVLIVNENSVTVDVSQNACFVKEGIERTVKSHKRYKIIKSSAEKVENQSVTTIKNYSKQEGSKVAQFKREDLTLEHYKQYKAEGISDAEILRMYDIPSGSWTKIKKNLFGDVAPKQQKATPTSTESRVVPVVEHDNAIHSLNARIDDLQKEKQQLSVALDEMTEKHNSLFAALESYKEATELHIQTIGMLENNNKELQTKNEALQDEADRLTVVSNDYAMELERVNREMTTYFQTSHTEEHAQEPVVTCVDNCAKETNTCTHDDATGCPTCESMRDQFNSQLSYFKSFELSILERLVFELKR